MPVATRSAAIRRLFRGCTAPRQERADRDHDCRRRQLDLCVHGTRTLPAGNRPSPRNVDPPSTAECRRQSRCRERRPSPSASCFSSRTRLRRSTTVRRRRFPANTGRSHRGRWWLALRMADADTAVGTGSGRTARRLRLGATAIATATWFEPGKTVFGKVHPATPAGPDLGRGGQTAAEKSPAAETTRWQPRLGLRGVGSDDLGDVARGHYVPLDVIWERSRSSAAWAAPARKRTGR